MKGSTGKPPSIQWYYKDWLSDARLQRAHPSTRGIWMNILMHMIDCTTDGMNCKAGEFELSVREISSLGSCSEKEAELFIDEALRLKFCDITVSDHGSVTVMSRRINRDDKKRIEWRKRKKKQREREKAESSKNDSVTPTSHQPHATSPIPTPTPTSKNITTSPANADILKKIDKLAEELYEHGRFPKVHAFKNKMLKLNKNAYALCHTLERLSVAKNINPESAWAYCAKIMGVEDGNYNEQDFRKRAEQQRRELEKFAAENELKI